MPFVQCKDCLEWQEGRCLRNINKGGCYSAETAERCMRAAEIREDPLPSWLSRYVKAWWGL